MTERSRGDAPPPGSTAAAVGPEAFAAAVAASAVRQDPQVARETSAFLRRQSQLLELQAKQLEEAHALRLVHLRHQSRLLRAQRIGQGFRIVFHLATALIAVAICTGIGVMLYDAIRSRGVVLEPFDVPPALAASGETGRVVTGALRDELIRLRGASGAERESRRGQPSAWSGEVRVAAPQVGASLGELGGLLRARFGHDLYLFGQVVVSPAGGLALSVRGDGIAPRTFVSAGGDASAGALAGLTTLAAEYVYGQAQPVQWANYLASSGRYEELIAFARQAYLTTQHTDRARLLDSWAFALMSTGKVREAVPLLRQAMPLVDDPHYFGPYYLLSTALAALGDEEGAYRVGQQMLQAAGGRPGRAGETWYQALDSLTWNLLAERDALVADRDAAGGAIVHDEGLRIADLEVRLHDPTAAELALNTSAGDNRDPGVVAARHFVAGQLAAQAGDPARAVSELEAFGKSFNDADEVLLPGAGCWIAPAEEAAGQPDRADAILKAGGTFVDCYRFRADILDHRGDWESAQKAYADAVALAPDLPAAYYSWGLALARHADVAGALVRLIDANQRGPHWADPLKAWGDLLAKNGDLRQALEKYDEALRLAPNWEALKQARAALAKRVAA